MIGRTVAPALLLLALLAGAGGLGPAWAQDSTEQQADSSLVDEAPGLLERINRARTEIDDLREQAERTEGEEGLLLERRRMNRSLEALSELDALVSNVLEQEEQGLDASEFRAAVEDLVTTIAPLARQRIDELQSKIVELAAQREATAGEELVALENLLGEENQTLDTILDAALNNVLHMQALGLDAASEEKQLSKVLTERAATSAERIRLSIEQIGTLQDRLAENPDDADLKAQISAGEAKRDGSTATLETMIGLMTRLELDTAEYQQLLIESTGQITTDILDAEVAVSLLARWLEGIKDWFIESGPLLFFRVVVFLLILFVFQLLARVTRRVVAKAVAASKLHFSQLLQKMFVSASGNVVRLIGLLVALSQFGFALGPVLAGLGIVGFILGFALQDTLGNLAAGMMILMYRPFDVGDSIEAAGVFGRVSAMNMVSTTILTFDHQTLVVPNGKIWGDVIKNVTAQEVRRVDMVFGISYTDDIPHTEAVLDAILKEEPKVLDDPEPIIRLHTLGKSSVDFVVRPWCKTDDYWEVYWNVTREVKMRFDREGISIPFPQRDVHFHQVKGEAPAIAANRVDE